MRNRILLLSGVSAFAVLASVIPAKAADTISGPGVTPTYSNAETDTVTINLDATLGIDANNDSFINNIPMSFTGPNLIIDDSTLVGDLVNGSEMISTTATAIQVLNDSQIGGQIANSGTIDGAVIGIWVTDDSTLLSGIANSGTISGGATGILLNNDASIFGGITNSGNIDGGAGIFVNDAQSELHGGIRNQTGGQIVGTTNAAIALSGNAYSGGITNAGTISGQTSADGIYMTGGTFTGDINNTSGTIQATGSSGIAIEITAGTFTGGISNSGKILGEATNGVAIRVLGTTDFNGNITNTTSGAIRGDVVAIVLSNTTFDGNLTNQGEITSNNGVGVSISTTTFTGNIDNQFGATINAPSTAVLITSATFTGNFTNAGSIDSASDDAVIINATAFTGNFTNSGHITASDNAVVFTGAVFTGGVTNSGEIASFEDALRVEGGTTVTGSITNSGTIHSTSQDGIDINGTVSGSITNSGTIFGLRDGIDIDGTVTGGVTNSGTIIGETGAAIDVSGSATGHTITQSSGLIRGGDGGETAGVALDLGNASIDTVSANGGTIDGDINASAGDDVVMNPTNSFVYLRGTATGVDRFDMNGSGTALLGAPARGSDTGVGVTINAVRMSHGGEGTLYLDDNTDINLSGAYTQTDGTLEYYLTPDTTTHATINAATAALGGRAAAFIDPLAFAVAGGASGPTYVYEDVITGTTAGTFSNAGTIDTNSMFFEGEADVHAAAVDIILTRQGFSSTLLLPAITHNQAAVGGALETIFGNGLYGSDFEDLYAYLFALPEGSEHDLEHIYDELAGAEHADNQEIGLRMSHAFDNTIAERLDDLRSASAHSIEASRLRRYAQADAMVVSDSMPANELGGLRGAQSLGIWAQAYGDWTEAEGDLEAAAYDQDTTGIAGGIDAAISHNIHAGAAIGWSQADVEFATPGDETEVDAFNAALYAAFEQGHFFADAVLSFASQDITTAREIDLGFGIFDAASTYNATTWGLHGEAGWVVRFNGGSFEPFAGLHYANLSTDGFSETGAGAYNLIVAGQDADTLTSSLGARLAGNWTDGGVRLIPSLEVSWRHEYMDERQSFLASFEEDPTTRFQIVSSALARDSAVVKAGLGAEFDRGFMVFLDYNGVYNTSANSHGATAGVRASW